MVRVPGNYRFSSSAEVYDKDGAMTAVAYDSFSAISFTDCKNYRGVLTFLLRVVWLGYGYGVLYVVFSF